MTKAFRTATCAVLIGTVLSGCTSTRTPARTATLPAAGGPTAHGVASTSSTSASTACAPVFDPASFGARPVDNKYYPLPLGRVLVYRGTRDGQTQTDTVTVTRQTKIIDGVTAVVVADKAEHDGTPLEETLDYFAQDRAGTVWYLGEDTKSFDPDGTVDTSGSWTAGVNGATPGVIMLADPRVPCGYRQEFLRGEAEDTAWIIGRGATVTVPYGTLKDTVRSLEVTVLEPDVVDEKVYAPGLGIVRERSLAGPAEMAKLVSVRG